MASRFNALKADAHWQKVWEERQSFAADDASAKPRSYVLEMFPYPSGRIHMGHVRNYTMGDVLARYRRMTGHEVLHPMGWDAFGMPAENAAMEKNVHPGAWTRQNIATMKAQLKRLGFALDWSRELATCEPDYYGHEQALFLDFFAAGLVYRKESSVNWDPVDMTVLANEQVIDGRGWRSGATVEKRKLSQWFLKITQFADELLAGLGALEHWPDKVRLMQENWIGKSQGLQFRFALSDGDDVEVFTTRPDTIFGASFVAVAADHPIAQGLAADRPEVAAFIERCKQGGTTAAELDTAEKLGFDTGLTARHPLDPAWDLPVYIANFVLMDYGTGAVFGVPAHDQRDLDFARKYGLPVTRVVSDGDRTDPVFVGDEAWTGPGSLCNSRFLDGLDIADAKRAVIERAEGEGWGKGSTVFRLRDWGVSPPALLGHADPDRPLRGVRGRAGAPRSAAGGAARGRVVRHPRQPARPSSDLEARRLPRLRRGGGARDRHARHLCRFVVVLHPLRQPARRQAVRPRGRRALAAGRPVYRRGRACDPPPALRALLDARAEAHRQARHRRAVHRAVYAGDGDARDV